MNGSILHVCHWDPKFVPEIIDFLNDTFDETRQSFVVLGAGSHQTKWNNVTSLVRVRGNIKFLRQEISSADRVVIHGLFSSHLVYLLASLPSALPRCLWFIWGGDLYDVLRSEQTLRWRVQLAARRFVIRRFGGVVTPIAGDVDFARNSFGFRGRQYPCIGYLSNCFLPASKRAVDDTDLTVLLGNSATPSNRHTLGFQALAATGRSDFRVICPLSYGDTAYRDDVIRQGRAMFGDRFTPILEFLPRNEYLELLAQATVAVFPHDRQQAVGNVIAALGSGLRVHMDPSTTHYRYFSSLGFIVEDVGRVNLDPLTAPQRAEALSRAVDLFSREQLARQYAQVVDMLPRSVAPHDE